MELSTLTVKRIKENNKVPELKSSINSLHMFLNRKNAYTIFVSQKLPQHIGLRNGQDFLNIYSPPPRTTGVVLYAIIPANKINTPTAKYEAYAIA